MNRALEKNGQALLTLFENEALVHRLLETRLAVVLPADATSASAKLLAQVLADTLGRLWPNIDFIGAYAEQALQVAQSAAASGEAPVDGLRLNWAPPYNLVVRVGCPAPAHEAAEICVGADGWAVALGPEAACGNDLNPVGPAFAAALAAAQIFAHCFAGELAGARVATVREWSADVRELFGAPNLQLQDLDLGETHVFGVGAVTHGMTWLLERWPEMVTGVLHLVDRDRYDSGNGQRYAFMKSGDWSQAKVAVVAERLEVHRGLVVRPQEQDFNSYCLERGYDQPLERVVVGLDSPEGRRQAALKLPDRTVNMWTGGMHAGAGQYRPNEERGCLACAYLEPAGQPLDEVAEIHRSTGLRPDEVRGLLDSARGLTEAEAQTVAAHTRLPDFRRLVGEPIRSVLPVLCATTQLPIGQVAPRTDVPLSFSSLFAGISGFMMLLRDVQERQDVSIEWKQHLFKRPSPLMLHPLARHHMCVRCTSAKLFQR